MNRRLVYTVAVGPLRPLWDRCITSMQAYCHRHGIDHFLQTEPLLRIVPKASQRSANALKLGYLPIYEKANAFAMLADYDEIAVIDADVWAQPDAGNIFDAVPSGYDFAAAIEREMPVTPAYAQKLRWYARGQYGDPEFPFRNMGVMVLRPSLLRFLMGQTPAEFIHRPQFEKFVNGEGNYRWSTDQTLLNVWLRDCGARVFDLQWTWNALYGAIEHTCVLKSQMVHFFLSSHLTGDAPEKMLRDGNARPRI